MPGIISEVFDGPPFAHLTNHFAAYIKRLIVGPEISRRFLGGPFAWSRKHLWAAGNSGVASSRRIILPLVN